MRVRLGVVVLALATPGAARAQACDLTVEGTVTDEVFGTAMAEVYVELAPASGDALSTETDASGRFALTGVCAGPYELRVIADEHAPVTRRITVPTEPLAIELHDETHRIIVVGKPLGTEDTRSVTTLDAQTLVRSSGDDLAETAAIVPGVAVQRGNGDTSKPIIRGQTERRLLTLFDGVRNEGQKWGPDHATEVDPFAAGSVEVIKGAAGVRYGPDAIGGVLLVAPRPLRVDPGVDGAATVVGASNGRRGTAAFRLDGAPASTPGLAWRLEGNLSRGAALQAPDYVLGNTGSALWNAGGTLGYHRQKLDLTASFRHYALQAGVFYGVRNESPTDLAAQLALGRPTSADLWRVSYKIDRPAQRVDHDLGLLRARFDLGAGTLSTTYSFQNDARREFEPVRSSVTGPQFDFALRTHLLDATFTHPRVHVGHGSAEGTAGVTASLQENVYRGLPLIPNYRAGTFGVFAYERFWNHTFEGEVGARYDHQGQTAFLTKSAWQRHDARGNLDGVACTVDGDVVRCPRSFDAATVSLGGLWRAVPDHLRIKVDLSSATRFPDVDELYINGTAPTLPIYALGDPSLKPETSWSGSTTALLDSRAIVGEASGYANLLPNFVYFAPDRGDDGSLGLEVLARGAFPRFGYTSINAMFYGADGAVTLGPRAPLALTVQGAIVRAIDTTTGEGLVFIPADRASATITARPVPPARGPSLQAAVTGSVVARQTRVDPAADLAPPPPGYGLLSASIDATFELRRGVLDLGLQTTNLLNTRYRDYTSLNRYFSDEPGRDVRLRARWSFGPPPHRSTT